MRVLSRVTGMRIACSCPSTWIVIDNSDSADLSLQYHHLTRLALVPSPLQTSQCVLGSLPPPPLLPGVGVEEVDAVEVEADGVGEGE